MKPKNNRSGYTHLYRHQLIWQEKDLIVDGLTSLLRNKTVILFFREILIWITLIKRWDSLHLMDIVIWREIESLNITHSVLNYKLFWKKIGPNYKLFYNTNEH